MRVLIAPDSFKECATAVEVARAMGRGARRAFPGAGLDLAPMADGGEGTVEALVTATNGRMVAVTCTGPLGEPVEASYGVLGDGTTAVIEMAAASGLHLVPPARRDPRVTTTYGTGELVRHALDAGYRRLVVGIGGSATNDGGAGLAEALGYRLLDADGAPLPRGGAALARLAAIDASGRHGGLAGAEVRVARDVTNPLCGPRGASHVYGPQKGATPATVEELDRALARLAGVIHEQLGMDVSELPGGGAAGGLGAGLVAFAGGRLESGFALVAEASRLDERVAAADLVLTGEGRLDAQTAQGKTPAGVAALGARHGKPVVALAGMLAPGYEALYGQGLTAAFAICPGPMTLDEALARAPECLEQATEAAVRAFAWGRQGRE